MDTSQMLNRQNEKAFRLRFFCCYHPAKSKCQSAKLWSCRGMEREHESRFMLPLPTNHQSGKTTETSIYASRCERFDHRSLCRSKMGGQSRKKRINKILWLKLFSHFNNKFFWIKRHRTQVHWMMRSKFVYLLPSATRGSQRAIFISFYNGIWFSFFL